MQITPKSKINDLLETYPQLETFLMDLNPKYKKLKNPILRRTVAKIATLTQVAKIGGYEPIELVNLLRKEVGQPPLQETIKIQEQTQPQKPAWAEEKAAATLNANLLLDQEKNPLAEASKALKALQKGEILAIESDFFPSPLIDTFQEQGYDVYSEEKKGGFMTLVRKS